MAQAEGAGRGGKRDSAEDETGGTAEARLLWDKAGALQPDLPRTERFLGCRALLTLGRSQAEPEGWPPQTGVWVLFSPLFLFLSISFPFLPFSILLSLSPSFLVFLSFLPLSFLPSLPVSPFLPFL